MEARTLDEATTAPAPAAMGVDDELLVTAAEIARRLGLKGGQAVLDLRRHRVGFPLPVGRRARALVWLWDDVELWAVLHAPAVGGPLGVALAKYFERVV
jgi:hypothetical protein